MHVYGKFCCRHPLGFGTGDERARQDAINAASIALFTTVWNVAFEVKIDTAMIRQSHAIDDSVGLPVMDFSRCEGNQVRTGVEHPIKMIVL